MMLDELILRLQAIRERRGNLEVAWEGWSSRSRELEQREVPLNVVIREVPVRRRATKVVVIGGGLYRLNELGGKQ